MSSSIRNFKTDFCRPKPADCRAMLERHGLDVGKLWSAPLPSAFDFLDRNSALVKLETS